MSEDAGDPVDDGGDPVEGDSRGSVGDDRGDPVGDDGSERRDDPFGDAGAGAVDGEDPFERLAGRPDRPGDPFERLGESPGADGDAPDDGPDDAREPTRGLDGPSDAAPGVPGASGPDGEPAAVADPFEGFGDAPGDPFADGESVFAGVEDGDAVWEEMDDADRAAIDDVPGRRYVEVSKHSYCERCEHFSAPPEVTCTHEGTEILEFTDMETVRVVDCPVVAERRALEDQG